MPAGDNSAAQVLRRLAVLSRWTLMHGFVVLHRLTALLLRDNMTVLHRLTVLRHSLTVLTLLLDKITLLAA